ncbi:MAG: methylated-DNA--[protein]-cysteine S-methyltransferase [Candidatus Nanopelagicales bacterium]
MIIDVLEGGPEPLVVIADDGAVVAAGFAPVDRIVAMLPTGSDPVPGDLPDVRQVWQDYLDGDYAALDRVVVRQSGSPVRTQVWDALREVRPGEPVSYGEMADIIGRPRAARAVGSACGANHVAPFVPCHRVIAANGGLGGYGYGLPVKRWLLDHESDRASA